ncbi:cobyric acid synthase [Thalassotalea euphylliae]|uniref:cobyric acid synthase n=1 Tax=Thalassotalea euphylliae TaxID=1655234 RepID=UPI003638E43A
MKALMVQGTTSDAGKSTLVAGLCRVLANAKHKVAPFKPQNMALNSAVTEDGGEIGRAQALQAVAARVPSHTDFNPILLKPNTDTGAQVIVHGKAVSNMEAASYHDYKKVALDAVLTSYSRLSERFDYLLVEGAGSPAEINLRDNDIANMGFAEAVDCPVIIIADIDKGGVFAHLVGTLALLSESEQARVKGFVINRFRGDISLLQSGLDWLEDRTGKPVLGVLPYLHDLALDAEDALATANVVEQAEINISVLLLPHISNHTDFDSLRLNPHVNLRYVRVEQDIPPSDLIIIPGSKNVLGDLAFLKEQGWAGQVNQHLRYGGKLLGICGGFQMLGNHIYDMHGVESSSQLAKGLGLADFDTELQLEKVLAQVSAKVVDERLLHSVLDVEIQGYEIHCGESNGPALSTPFATVETELGVQRHDGFVSEDGQIIGTYLHGLFDTPEAANTILHWVNPSLAVEAIDVDEHREVQLSRLAKICEKHLDMNQIYSILRESKRVSG